MLQGDESGDEEFQWAHAKSARRQQNRSAVRRQSVFEEPLVFVFVQGEERVNRAAADSDLVARNCQSFEVGARFVNRDEILFIMVAEPHSVNIKVGDDNRLAAGNALFGFEPRDNLGRQEVRADYHIGLVFAQQFDERARVEFVEREPATFVLPRLVELVINPAGYFRQFVDGFNVSFGVEMTEYSVGEFESVNVADLKR